MLLSLLLSAAHAAEPYDHTVSITLSPFHLVLPVLEVTGEYRVHDRVGVAATGGYGVVQGFTTVELGASGRFYPVGDFDHGMQLGLEAQYARLFGTVAGYEASGSGTTMGPFIGYKIAARFGLTFEIQAGAQYTFVAASATDGTDSATASDKAFGLLLNLQLGWSF